MRTALLLASAAACSVGLWGCGGGYEVGKGGLDPAGAGESGGPVESPQPAAPPQRSAEEIQRSVKNLGQIARAMLAYADNDRYRSFPTAAIRGRDGTPLLSWRVALLPFLGQQALYSQFHLDEPWDSPHNSTLVAQMPDVYRSAANEPGTTSFMVFVGEGAPFGGVEPTKLSDIKDGTSNTIICVEAGPDRGVPWTKPEDLPFQPENPVAALGQISGDRFVVAFIDGATQQIRKDLEPEKLRGLITHWGGELVFPHQLR